MFKSFLECCHEIPCDHGLELSLVPQQPTADGVRLQLRGGCMDLPVEKRIHYRYRFDTRMECSMERSGFRRAFVLPPDEVEHCTPLIWPGCFWYAVVLVPVPGQTKVLAPPVCSNFVEIKQEEYPNDPAARTIFYEQGVWRIYFKSPRAKPDRMYISWMPRYGVDEEVVCAIEAVNEWYLCEAWDPEQNYISVAFSPEYIDNGWPNTYTGYMLEDWLRTDEAYGPARRPESYRAMVRLQHRHQIPDPILGYPEWPIRLVGRQIEELPATWLKKAKPPSIEHSPQHSEHSPQQSEHAPQHSEHTLQHSEHTLEHSEHSPQQSEHALQHLEHTLQQSEHTLQHSEHILQHSEHAPQQAEHALQHLEHALQHLEHTLQHSEHTLQHSEHSPQQSEHALQQSEHSPQHSEHSPQQSEHALQHSEHSPQQSEHALQHSEHSPQHSEHSPQQSEHALQHSEHSPEQSEHAPQQSEHALQHSEHSPEQSEHAPQHSEHSAQYSDHTTQHYSGSPEVEEQLETARQSSVARRIADAVRVGAVQQLQPQPVGGSAAECSMASGGAVTRAASVRNAQKSQSPTSLEGSIHGNNQPTISARKKAKYHLVPLSRGYTSGTFWE